VLGVTFVYILQGKMGKTEKTRKERWLKYKENKRRKYGMNETLCSLRYGLKISFGWHDSLHENTKLPNHCQISNWKCFSLILIFDSQWPILNLYLFPMTTKKILTHYAHKSTKDTKILFIQRLSKTANNAIGRPLLNKQRHSQK